MNSEWVAIKDAVSGRIYYANTTTKETQWETPYGFNDNSQPHIFSNNAYSQTNLHQPQHPVPIPSSDHVSPQWRGAYDPATGNRYWWNTVTRETTWTKPTDINGSLMHFDATWGQDSDDDHNDDWDEDDDDDDDTDVSDSGLEIYDAAKQAQKVLGQSLVDDAATDPDIEDDEKAVNPMDDNEEILVRDITHTYWCIAQNEGHKYPLRTFAEQHFQTNKHNKMFKKYDINELIKCTPYNKMHHALLKMNGKMDKTAQQIWKNINSYILLRKSNKADFGHVDKLLRFALKAPDVLRDEIFCQICKQTHCNPSVDSLIKGWKLMSICCSIFPPTDEFAAYLCTYLYNKTTEAGVIGEYAKFALLALDRSMVVGQRRIQPMDTEIQRIEHRECIPIKIYFCDGTFRTFLITSQTQTQQIIDEMTKVLRMNHGESFGVFEMEEIKGGWEQRVYAKRKTMKRQEQIDGLQCMPCDRELEVNERIMDVLSSWIKNGNKKNKRLRLVFKCKIYSKAQENSYSFNDWKIAFLSVVHNVIHAMYPLERDDIYHLSAIQLQATHGIKNETFYCEGIVQGVINAYIPHTHMNNNNISDMEMERNILKIHEIYCGLDKRDAFSKYMQYLRSTNVSSYCGCSFYRCVRVMRLRKTQLQLNPIIDLLLGISENGILFIDPMTFDIVDRYKMEEIITYGFRSNAFLLVAGTLMTQRKFQFATMFGKQMNDTLKQHIDLRVQQAEVQGFSFQQ